MQDFARKRFAGVRAVTTNQAHPPARLLLCPISVQMPERHGRAGAVGWRLAALSESSADHSHVLSAAKHFTDPRSILSGTVDAPDVAAAKATATAHSSSTTFSVTGSLFRIWADDEPAVARFKSPAAPAVKREAEADWVH